MVSDTIDFETSTPVCTSNTHKNQENQTKETPNHQVYHKTTAEQGGGHRKASPRLPAVPPLSGLLGEEGARQTPLLWQDIDGPAGSCRPAKMVGREGQLVGRPYTSGEPGGTDHHGSTQSFPDKTPPRSHGRYPKSPGIHRSTGRWVPQAKQTHRLVSGEMAALLKRNPRKTAKVAVLPQKASNCYIRGKSLFFGQCSIKSTARKPGGGVGGKVLSRPSCPDFFTNPRPSGCPSGWGR